MSTKANAAEDKGKLWDTIDAAVKNRVVEPIQHTVHGVWCVTIPVEEYERLKANQQYKVAVPMAERRDGWLYDADSGVCVGLASVESREQHGYNTRFKMTLAGCPHNVVIHKKVPA